MAYKLTKAQRARLRDLNERLAQSGKAVRVAMTDLRQLIADEVSNTNVVLANHALDVGQMQVFAHEIVEAAQTEYDDHSEAWQESDRGAALADFLDEWERVLEATRAPATTEVTIVDPDNPDVLEPIRAPEEA